MRQIETIGPTRESASLRHRMLASVAGMIIAAATMAALTMAGASASATGNGWMATRAPVPPGAVSGATAYDDMTGVSCPVPGWCVSVGAYATSNSFNYEPLAEVISGGTTTVQTVPDPLTAGTGTKTYTYLNRVTCPAQGTCVAVGAYRQSLYNTRPFEETMSDGTWTATALPEPAGSGVDNDQYSGLEGISCLDMNNCTAVGFYDDSTGHQREFIETLSGGEWTAMPAPVPGNAGSGTEQNGGLLGIVCTTVGSCTAAGYYETATGGTSGLRALHLTGVRSSG